MQDRTLLQDDRRAPGPIPSGTVDDAAEPAVPCRGRRRLVLPAVLLSFAVLVAASMAWRGSHEVPTWHMDGAFQTASGLFRLADGQVPGRDFLPYLGIAPILMLYPVFALLGGELTDTVFTARLVTLLAFEAVVGVLALLIAGRRPLRALAWGSAAAALLIVAAELVEPRLWAALDGLLTAAAVPGNSLRPIRAFAPYLLAAVAYTALSGGWTVRRAAVVGASAGLVAALWSNDYGPVSGTLLLAAVTVHALRHSWSPRMRGMAALYGGAAAGYVGAGLAATAGHFTSLLAYNFSDVRSDQFWYFGPWGEPSRVFTMGDLMRILTAENALSSLAVLVTVTSYALVRRGLGSLLVTFLGTATLMGGVTATVGGHAANYFWAFVFWGHAVSAVALVRLAAHALAHVPAHRMLTRALRVTVTVAMVAVMVVAGGAIAQHARQAGGVLAADPRYHYDEALGGFLDSAFISQVRTARETEPRAVEEYLGLSGVVDGPQTALVDSVIAALGRQREPFAAQLAERPELVVTTAPDTTNWVTWNLSANWWFYRDLFRGYAPVLTSPQTVSWTPVEPTDWTEVPCRTEDAQIVVETPDAGLYEVALQYKGPGRIARAFTMVENHINIASDARGFVSLDPGGREQRFPVAVRDPGSGVTVLDTRDISADDGPLTRLESCTAAAITYPVNADTADVYSRLPAPPGPTAGD